MIRAIYFVLFFNLIGHLSAQKMPFTEVIYLRNGSIIRGTIVEIVPNTQYKIQTSDGSAFIFEEKDILKIAREFPVKTSKSNGLNKINTTMEAGYGAKSGQYGLNVINVNALINYQLN